MCSYSFFYLSFWIGADYNRLQFKLDILVLFNANYRNNRLLLVIMVLYLFFNNSKLCSCPKKYLISDENLRKCNCSGIHILLAYTHHLQYIFTNLMSLLFQVLLLFTLRCLEHTFVENSESCTNITILARMIV